MATFAKASFGHASYASFRPTYPNNLYQALLSFHQGPKTLCLDLGCGTGIASFPLARRFDRVIGTDPSAGMVSQAQKSIAEYTGTMKLNLSFQQASAEHSPSIQDGEVDCVTAAQAAHWFDYPKLWPELKRITRKGGTVAFWGYKDHVFPDFPAASEIMQDYAYNSHPDRLGSYWPQPGRSYVQDKLRVIQPPEADWEDVQRVEYEPGLKGAESGEGTLFMKRTVTVGECKEYVRTWSSYHGWKETHPGEEARSKGGEGDVVDQIFDEMAVTEKHFGAEENEVYIEWGSALVMARRK
ncbi:Putative methyltransferase type 11, S-adenosyl-L-methionine-dependent methyltransferase [Septoria linicola]|uniref:Methyltransferase type 11, S-adenosyl-L-methionine-dependent methyltransferase n=1 Tax=Septoria linicola TaxID=215465 RepID=A0A9Q9ATL2_9PEZI|nr:putative methyltransferase type 11, S-adenosyl-L-methionine-dependent methyltransferase [Septoria linicola]USW54489.1 Putative methyltransferase type 11, S-adenosyl-L-methionine-dependent methyltransferase [Septoria linicola]